MGSAASKVSEFAEKAVRVVGRGIHYAAKAVQEALSYFADRPENDVNVESRVAKFEVTFRTEISEKCA